MTKHSELHRKHEELTQRLYNNPEMLPARYVFILTNRCNLSCPFCFQHRRRTPEIMDKTDWLALIPQLPDYARVTLTGGEPLVYPGFEEILTSITEKHDCNVISNGVLLSENIIDMLLDKPRLKVFSISIDDIGNHSRQIRDGDWKQMISMTRHLLERRNRIGSELKLDVKTVVLDENADQLFDIYRYCVEELGCDTHSFQFLKGSPLQHADKMYPFSAIFEPPQETNYSRLDVIQEQLEKVRAYAIKYDYRSYLHPQIGDMQSNKSLPDWAYFNDTQHNPEHYQPCKAPWSSVHINADGHLFPCLAVSMGNVKHKPLRDIIFDEPFSRFRKTIREQGTVNSCSRCGWLKPASEKLLSGES